VARVRGSIDGDGFSESRAECTAKKILHLPTTADFSSLVRAAEALKAARAAGTRVGIDVDDLVLEASAPPPCAVLDLLSLSDLE
jgi:hypothetical protein